MNRNGKIARLPDDIRQELNDRLSNGEEGPQLLAWLNALPETRELLDEDFNGVPISKQNLSEWRQGGYREWCVQDDLHGAALEFSEGVRAMEEMMNPSLLPGDLAAVLAARYAKVLLDWDGKPNKKLDAVLNTLRFLGRDIALLQKTLHLATNQRNEFEQKLEDDEIQERKEMKTKALAPISAFLQEKSYAAMLGGDPGAKQIAAIIAAVDNDQPIPESVRAPTPSQTKSNPVKPSDGLTED
jgi:hypothetical protein